MNHGQALIDHNRAAWDRQASEVREWSRPVESSTIAAARYGRWQVHLTPREIGRASCRERVSSPV